MAGTHEIGRTLKVGTMNQPQSSITAKPSSNVATAVTAIPDNMSHLQRYEASSALYVAEITGSSGSDNSYIIAYDSMEVKIT